MRRLRLLVLLVLPWLIAPAEPSSAADEVRLALVIGIGGYEHAPSLANPTRDAQAMGAELGKLGFAVDLVLDPDYRALSAALREFGRKAADSDLALIYFAGHGVQVEGQNFLIPADAQLERERDLVYEAMALNLYLGEVGQARKLGIMILDSCRDNPFVDRLSRASGSHPSRVKAGLNRIDDTPSDTVVAMATRANAVAEDDAGGQHSPYTEALLDELKVPGLELGLFFRRVRDRVVQSTNGRQEPYNFGSFGATPIYLNPEPANRPPIVTSAPPLRVVDNAAPTSLAVPSPTDPDQDQLVVQVIGLPQGGTTMVGNRALLIGDYLTAEQLKAASFKPDGSRHDDVGSFDYSVSDGRGGLVKGAVAVTVNPSNHPPSVAAVPPFQVAANRLTLPAVADPDGDSLTLRIRAVPEHGRLRRGRAVLEAGDRLDPGGSEPLTFDPEDTPPGPAGELAFSVEDGRGGEASGSITFEVVAPGAGAAPPSLDAAVWRRLGPQPSEGMLRAFLQLFPQSPFAAEAQRRLGSSVVATAPAPPAQPTVKAVLTPTPAPRSAPPSSPVPQAQKPMASSPAAAKPAATPAPTPQPPASAPGAPSEPSPVTEPAQVAEATAPKSTRTNGDGTSFQDCAECPVIVRIPAGSFTMGSESGDRSERPMRKVTVAKPFGLGRYEVTIAQWQACITGGGCAGMPAMRGSTDETPVHNVTFSDASAYVTWLVRKTGQSYRLPTEAEWEYAARAGTTSPYWWGEKVDGRFLICRKCGSAGFVPATPPAVDTQPANPWGLIGMSGGVREWLADCWIQNYDKAPTDVRPRLVRNCAQHVTRGGSWLDEPADLRVSSRGFYDAEVPYLVNGFRVARDLE